MRAVLMRVSSRRGRQAEQRGCLRPPPRGGAPRQRAGLRSCRRLRAGEERGRRSADRAGRRPEAEAQEAVVRFASVTTVFCCGLERRRLRLRRLGLRGAARGGVNVERVAGVVARVRHAAVAAACRGTPGGRRRRRARRGIGSGNRGRLRGGSLSPSSSTPRRPGRRASAPPARTPRSASSWAPRRGRVGRGLDGRRPGTPAAGRRAQASGCRLPPRRSPRMRGRPDRPRCRVPHL